MKRLKTVTRIGEILIAIILVLSIGWWVGRGQAETPAYDINTTTNLPMTKTSVLGLVNQQRSKSGLKPLKETAKLDAAAQLKADDMSKRNYLSHTIKGTKYTLTPEMADLEYANCSYTSENFYWGEGDRRTPESTLEGWMGSAPHRKALLDSRYTLTGIGVAGSDRVIVVEHFCISK